MNTYDCDMLVDKLNEIYDRATRDEVPDAERGRGDYETIPAFARDEDQAWYDQAEENDGGY